MRQFSYLLILSFLFSFSPAKSQIDRGGYPKSFSSERFNSNFQKIEVHADRSSISLSEKSNEGGIVPHKIGFTINTDLSPVNSGTWFTLDNGDKVWKLAIHSSGAEALAVYFKNFELPDDAELFLYNETKNQFIGAFTSDNYSADGYFGTELIEGDVVILEYFVSASSAEKTPFIISELGYVYRDSGFGTYKGFNHSGSCEINVNCSEGQDWQQQKKGVARIQVKEGSGLSWCTGSLINNTRNNFTPYFLTANHCGPASSAADYSSWIFYFNYESEDCNDPATEPSINTMTGASLIARTENDVTIASDFKLLLLNQEVPEEYDPYFNGWSRSLEASNSGVTIHHPSGDIKKISSYTSPLVSSNYDATSDNPDGMYWRVIWSETASGHGVTEGGSSGAPIFNLDGKIVGALTGGLASCNNLTAPDYYGKFSYSWESNDVTDDRKLQPWLDPDNTGVEDISGVQYNSVLFIPDFEADMVVIPIGGSLTFSDLSMGSPTQWAWTFEGGIPGSSTLQIPPSITYQTAGVYDVTLQISNSFNNESIIKEEYIRVVSVINPLPSDDLVTVYLGTDLVDDVIFTIYDESGREIEKHIMDAPIKHFDFYFGKYSAGYYFLRVQTPTSIEMHKIVIY